MMSVLSSQGLVGNTITYEGVSTLAASQNATGNIDITYPTVNANDILVAQVAVNYSSATWDQSISGWNFIYETVAGNNRLAFYWKRATGSESGSQSFTHGTAGTFYNYGVMVRFSGAETSGNPFDIMYQNAGTSTSAPVIPQMLVVSKSAYAFAFFQEMDNITVSGMTDYTKEFEVSSTLGADYLAAGFSYVVTGSSSPQDILSLATSENCVVFSVLFK